MAAGDTISGQIRVVKETGKMVYGIEPIVRPMVAGSSPMYTVQNYIGAPCVVGGGVGYFDSRVHAPNENINVDDYIQGI